MIELRELVKTYTKAGALPVRAINHVSLTVRPGEFVSILGPSGSGKSTLMNVIGLLDEVDSGEYRLNGELVRDLSGNKLAALRNRVLGFVFQAYHLLPRTTAIENVQLPLIYADRTDYMERSRAALAAVGLSERARHYASELSGGQKQRVAIARAIVNEPSILLADEPTGNLDSVSSREIIDLFHTLNRSGMTIIVITHDLEIARRTRRIIRLRDGAIDSDEAFADRGVPA